MASEGQEKWKLRRTRVMVNRMRKKVSGAVEQRGAEWKELTAEIRRRRERMLDGKDTES